MFDRAVAIVRNTAQVKLDTILQPIDNGFTLCKENIQELKTIYQNRNDTQALLELELLEKSYLLRAESEFITFIQKNNDKLPKIRKDLADLQLKLIRRRQALFAETKGNFEFQKSAIEQNNTLNEAIKTESQRIIQEADEAKVAAPPPIDLFAKAALKVRDKDKTQEQANLALLNNYLEAYQTITTSERKIALLKNNKDKNTQDITKTLAEANSFIAYQDLSPKIHQQIQNQKPPKKIEEHIQHLEAAIEKLKFLQDPHIKSMRVRLEEQIGAIETHLRENITKLMKKDVSDAEKAKIKLDIKKIETLLKAADKQLNAILQHEDIKNIPDTDNANLSDARKINEFINYDRLKKTFSNNKYTKLKAEINEIVNPKPVQNVKANPIAITPSDEPTLKQALIDQVKGDDAQKKAAMNSLFSIVAQMEPEALAAFYTALKRQDAVGKLVFAEPMHFDEITEAYLNLASANASGNKKRIENAKQKIKDPAFQKKLQTIQKMIEISPEKPEETLSAIIENIPKDPLSGNDIFSQPIPTIDNNNPRHEDIRRGMSRDLHHYRYVAPKGESGAQAAGPLGGWYIGCYRTRNGKIHTQRFMVKRENEYNKNITESICGRLKSSLVNGEQDYSAGTYLARQSNTAATGENTYAVSIAFNGFKESHQLAGFDKRVKMAGTKKKFFDGAARKIFAAIEKMHKKQHKGLEEALIAAWWTGDKDVHTGNIGYNSLRFLSIDHAGGLEDLGLKIHPGRDGLLQNALRVFRTHPKPTYHAAEYSSEIRNGEQMATAIKRATNQMSTEKLKELINEEIDSAVYNYRDDPDVFKKFAIRSSVPEAFLQGKDIDQQAAITKEHLYNTMHARLVNLRQYGKEIELSLCFEYKKPSNTLFYKKGEFVVKDPEKLAQFIRENPNYSLGDKHHFRGESNGHALTTAYHQTHNRLKYTSGNKLEELLAREREKVFAEEDKFGIRPFLANDFKILDLRERATNYIARFNLIKEILINENVHNTNPYKGKIDELLEFLDRYKSGVTTQHLTQICDEAYNVIQRIFETLDRNNNNNAELLAKLKIYETLSGKNLDTFTIDNSAYTLAIKSAAEQLESKLTKAQFNALQRDKIIEDKKTIETVVKQLSSLADEKNETQTTIPQIQTTLANLEERLTQAPPQTKQEYLTSVHSLSKKDELSFLDQGADYFHQDRTKAQDNVHATVTTPIIENIATENTAILLDNPTAVGKAGAVMINEGGQIKLFDFENPAISFASILAKTLLHHVVMSDHSPVSEEKLREIIQKNYINLLQDKNPPQLISKDNFNDFLLTNNQFNLKASSGFFKTSQADLKNTLYKTFEKEVASHHADLLSWATIWIKTLEAQGSQAKDMFLEGSSGNTEFARLFLILVCAKGEGLSNLKSANRTGYEFNITEHEIQLMRNHLAGKASSADISTLFAAQRALHIVIQKTEQHLSLPIETDLESLEISRNRYINDQTKLKALDPDGKYMQLYGDVLQKLSLKIDEINFEIAQLEPKVTATPGSGGPK